MSKESWLQFWHAELNRTFFDGELEPALVHIDTEWEQDDNEPPLAIFCGRLNPFLITFYCDPSDMKEIEALEVLLHEMVHQYCAEHGIEDMDDSGEHSSEFYRAASMHGLVYHGAVLSAEARENLTQRIKVVDAVSRIGGHGRA